MGTFFEAIFGFKKVFFFASFGDVLCALLQVCEVRTFWHWVDFLTQECHTLGKTPCYINLDETSVPRCLDRPTGFLAPRRVWPQQQAPRRHVKKQHRRGTLTHVALIADLPSVSCRKYSCAMSE